MLGLTLLATTAGAGRYGDFSIQNDSSDIRDCSDYRITSNGERLQMVTEEVPVSGTVRINSAPHGGVFIRGGANRTTVTACKAATLAGGRQIRITNQNGEISAEGPTGEHWAVFYIVRTARGADVAAETVNGPITVRDFEGHVTARAVNGPIALRDSSGTIDLNTTNGPIAITGSAGDVKARAQNGPVSVKLPTGSWNGNLDASTQNGPLSVRLPNGFRSGVVVESLGRSPITCVVEGCPETKRRYLYDHEDRERVRRIELGSGPANVRLSTQNGPVSVKELE
ncbi:MAG TPA: hypothetical protein VF618_27675 [Thermoanaerobaculia bacterium]